MIYAQVQQESFEEGLAVSVVTEETMAHREGAHAFEAQGPPKT